MTRNQILAAAVLAVGGIGLAGTTFGQATADQQQQSQQSSQTRGLITARRSAPAAVPRLRLRRRSVAHSWS